MGQNQLFNPTENRFFVFIEFFKCSLKNSNWLELNFDARSTGEKLSQYFLVAISREFVASD